MTAAAVVLAAGKGTRFRSDEAKVLHRVAGRALLRWVLEAVRPLVLDRVVVVVGHQADEVRAEAEAASIPGLVTVVQAEQRGTGHAVRAALASGALDGIDTVLVLPGDTPLLEPTVLAELLAAHDGHAATLLTAELPDPTGYGRVLRDERMAVIGIVEDRDATDEQRRISEVNTSMYAFARGRLAAELQRLTPDNDQGEEYLTDVVAPLVAAGVGAIAAPAALVAGVNDRAQLAAAGRVLRARILDRLMLDGVTVVDPDTTYVDADVRVAADATLLPGVHLEGETVIGRGARIGPDSRLMDSTVEDDATVTYSVLDRVVVGPGVMVGPFTHLRPGTRLEAGARAGSFVEMKNAAVGEGSKVPHLSYVGDARIGRGANVGAGTITCNYDGRAKHRTVIGDGAFIGSDTMLVAPVEVGAHGVTGAGSVITKDVPEGALSVERNEQRIVLGYAERKRARG
jgi:bifunctional UDP-N-acetylglucosamine pyrophosphorylase/glucosamine-1-phosphate N-acetyltransferase